MGKSTTITRLLESKVIGKNHWIIKIDLRDHLPAIQDIDNIKDMSLNDVFKFLSKVNPTFKKWYK